MLQLLFCEKCGITRQFYEDEGDIKCLQCGWIQYEDIDNSMNTNELPYVDSYKFRGFNRFFKEFM